MSGGSAFSVVRSAGRRMLCAAAIALAPLSPHQLQAASANASAPTPSASLVVSSGAARYLLATSPQRLLDAVDPDSRTALDATLRPDGTTLLDPLWSVLIAGSVQTRREAADAGATLWFNPVFDGGLVVLWRKTSVGWKVLAAAPILGETLRGEPIPMRPLDGRVAWPRHGKSLADSLAATAAASNAAAARSAWINAVAAPAGRRNAASAILMARVSRATLELRVMDTAPGYGLAVADVRRALANRDPSAMPPLDGARRGPLPARDARYSTMRAVDALRRTDGWTLALQSPDAPGAAWLAHLADPSPGQSAQVEVVGEVSIVAPSPPGASKQEVYP
ncbi:MAG: hypothetical protein ACHP84_13355 [Caulobacterales bacterium]